jgi:YrbI family 3-deoxy-D-manno-octulosonate 8-phosphate phosphatase
MLVKNIRLIVYDFDGVMTDNRVILREDGLESVVVNRQDGLAVSALKRLGLPQVIISTEANKVVSARARKLGIDVLQGVSDKNEILKRYCRRKNVPLKDVVYVGNDLNDLEAMRSVGHPVCPSDACKEIRSLAQIVLGAKGGEGVVRKLLDCIKTPKG